MVGGLLLFLLLIFFSFLFVAGVTAVALEGSGKKVEVKSNSVLKLELTDKIPEKSTEENPFESFDISSFKIRRILGLNDVLDCIKKAKTDDNIKGIYLPLGINENGYATIEVIRQALIDFRKSGKFVYAYGELMSQKSYYLATAADQIYLNPSGGMQLTGFGHEIAYFKDMLDKLGIQVQAFHCGAYKSAFEPLTRDNMSEPNRQQMMVLYDDVYSDFLHNISKERRIDTGRLNEIINTLAASTPEREKELKLVDDNYYYDQVLDKIKEKTGTDKKKDVEFIDAVKYASTLEKSSSSSNRVAIVYAEGDIVDGEGKDDEIGGEKFAKIIRKLREDDKVKAIVLRVNSPGGSAIASDVIWRELVLAKKEKPVVVSFGDYAASGGYFISCEGDRIFAEPNTITGSIGVFGLVPNGRKFFNDKLGITFDQVKITKHGVLGGITSPVEGEEAAVLQMNIDKTYREFKERVAAGRGKDTAYIETIAQGRVWTGNQGVKNGLVDEIGTLDDAIAYAVKKANLKDYRIKEYPEEKTFGEKIAESFSDSKANWIKQELGSQYDLYKTIETFKNMSGIQERMVYDLGM